MATSWSTSWVGSQGGWRLHQLTLTKGSYTLQLYPKYKFTASHTGTQASDELGYIVFDVCRLCTDWHNDDTCSSVASVAVKRNWWKDFMSWQTEKLPWAVHPVYYDVYDFVHFFVILVILSLVVNCLGLFWFWPKDMSVTLISISFHAVCICWLVDEGQNKTRESFRGYLGSQDNVTMLILEALSMSNVVLLFLAMIKYINTIVCIGNFSSETAENHAVYTGI